MQLLLAIKAFFKALKDPKAAQEFIADKKKVDEVVADNSHLRLLGLLQHSSRLIDFLKEDIKDFDDAQIGGAVRKIHADCAKCLEEIATIRPVMDEMEGAKICVPPGYDSAKIKVVGNVKGEPPYIGTLVHKGWKVHKRSLPKQVGDRQVDIICPAEVEIR